MNVILYSGFTKRVNSTARPSNATARTFDCVLKQGTSMIAPTIILDMGLETAPTAYTYAYIPDFNRYYWVRDWVNVHPVWHCSLTCDVLASGRSEILAYNAYVLRSSGAEYEGQLNDATCVTFTDPVTLKTRVELIHGGSSDSHTYVLGVVADSDQNLAMSGTTTYYVLTQSEMDALRAFLMSDFETFAGSLGSYTDPNMVKLFFNPSDYIVSCVCVPIPLTVYGTLTQTTIKLGWWDTGIVGYYLKSRTVVETVDITVPYHPDYNRDGVIHDDLQFLNYPPYTTHYLFLPSFGQIAIPPDLININDRRLRLTINHDCVTGVSMLIGTNAIGTGDVHYVFQASTQLGIPCDWGSVTVTPVQTAGMNQFTSGITTGAIMSANRVVNAQDKRSLIGSTLDAIVGNVFSHLPFIEKPADQGVLPDVIQGYNSGNSYPGYGGGAGSAASHNIILPQFLYTRCFTISERNVSELGRPYHHYQVLGSEMNTIVYCESPHVVSSLLTVDENEAINSALTSGVHIE